ncbi:MAG: DUF4373 domain-containing protein [Bacteroidaceae bacterium]|nr:DUF4373 domain-containing protein [Bacteroidaceae bacterium]
MPRIKKGLDYYCFLTDTFHDLRIKRLRRKCRNNGLLVYFYLLTEAYRTAGYCVEVNDELVLDVAEYFYLTEEEVEKFITICCTEGLFDKRIFEKFRVLTSVELQERYAAICYKLRRQEIGISPEHLLIEKPKAYAPGARKQADPQATETTPADCTPNKTSSIPMEESTQMKRNEMKRNEMKPLPFIPSPESGKGEAVTEEEIPLMKEEQILPNPGTPCPRGEGRNYAGLVETLQRLHIEVKDINAILKLSNFGEIGDPVWQALYTLNGASAGTFRQPVKYIYSVIQKARRQKGGVLL